MPVARAKLVIGGVLIASALSYLGMAGVRSGWVYYVDVDRFVQSPPPAGRRARIHGTVAAEGLDVRRSELSARFILQGERAQVRVAYRGAIPDLFQAGRQVVVEGAMDEGGTFQSDLLLTKCASKYEGRAEGAPATAEGAR